MRKILLLVFLVLGAAAQAQFIYSGSKSTAKMDTLQVKGTRVTITNSAKHASAYLKVSGDSLYFGDVKGERAYATLVAKNATLPLYTFGAGGGNAQDTVVFASTTIYGSFYNDGSDTICVTKLKALMKHGIGLDTLAVQVQWHATFLSGSATLLNTTALPVGRPLALTTGTADASFNNYKIPPGVWVWCTTPYVATGKKPLYLSVSISGYRK